jgi:hypothetical protein
LPRKSLLAELHFYRLFATENAQLNEVGGKGEVLGECIVD